MRGTATPAGLLAGLVVAAAGVAARAGGQPPGGAAGVLAAEAARRAAILANDTSALGALVSDSLVVTLADGTRRGRAEEVAQNAAADRGIEAWDASDVAVRVYGDAAVVTGYARLRDTLRGQRRAFGFHFTHVWVWRGGRWLLAARHMSGRREL
jgi:ketosteroid isomerase-like protein